MMIAAALVAIFSLYVLIPGDTSGVPYPHDKQEIMRQIVVFEDWLECSEKEFKKYEAYAHMKVGDNPFSEETKLIVDSYGDQVICRHNVKHRLKNLKKLLDKYEQINNDFSSRNSTADGGVATRPV